MNESIAASLHAACTPAYELQPAGTFQKTFLPTTRVGMVDIKLQWTGAWICFETSTCNVYYRATMQRPWQPASNHVQQTHHFCYHFFAVVQDELADAHNACGGNPEVQKPRRPHSACMWFCKQARQTVKEAHPSGLWLMLARTCGSSGRS
jgi:hypothetical protein